MVVSQPESPDLARFYSKTLRHAGGCLLWTGARNGGGYGVFSVAGKTVLAHRWIYEQEVGQIGDRPLDHVSERGCTFRHCVAVEHLEPVSAGENSDRARATRSTQAEEIPTSDLEEALKALDTAALQAIAAELGVSEATLWRYRRGAIIPIVRRPALARVLGLSSRPRSAPDDRSV